MRTKYQCLWFNEKKKKINAKISDIHKKYFTTSDYNKFTDEIFDTKLLQHIVWWTEINLATNCDVNTISQRAIKNKKKKLRSKKMFDLIKIFLKMMLFKIRLFINQHLIH